MGPLRGTVVDNQDDKKRGRCRVFVWGMHGDQNHPREFQQENFDDKLPWAETMGSTAFGLSKGVGVSSVLQVGTSVWVMFEQNDLQCPIICGVFVGHDGENMGDVSAENSDMSDKAKECYGNNQEIVTPGGTKMTWDECDLDNPIFSITTKCGMGLEMNCKEKTLKLSSGCGPEIKMDCNDQSLTITNGAFSAKIEGDTMKVHGNIEADGAIKAPNICYQDCAPKISIPQTSTQKSENKEKCSPNSEQDCSANYPPNTKLEDLDPKLKQLIEKAKEIYQKENPKSKGFYVCETKMSPERYMCLNQAGTSVDEKFLYGCAAVLNENECEKEAPVITSDQCKSGKGFTDAKDRVHFKMANGDPACYESDNEDIRALSRMLYSEVRGWMGTGADKNVMSIAVNRINADKAGYDFDGVRTIADVEAAPRQYDHNFQPSKRIIHEPKTWIKVQAYAKQFYEQYKAGNWKSTVGPSTFFQSHKNSPQGFKKGTKSFFELKLYNRDVSGHYNYYAINAPKFPY